MDFTPLITIIISAIAIYFFIKLIVHPLLKAIGGIIVFIIIIYIMQRYFGLNLENAFGPLGKYLNPEGWITGFTQIITQIINYIKKLLPI